MRNVVAALALLMISGSVGAAQQHRHPAPAADPRLEFLKALEGTWIVTEAGPDGLPVEAVFEFRVTAGGHAVEEREMVGTPMEMVTLYHMDGGDLVATHYCVLGNQPHVVASRRIVDGELSFACNGKPGNATSHDDEHVHAWSMQLADDGSLNYTAELMRAGEITDRPVSVLTRTERRAGR